MLVPRLDCVYKVIEYDNNSFTARCEVFPLIVDSYQVFSLEVVSVCVYRLYTVMILGASSLHKLSPKSKKPLAPGYKHVLDEGIALFSDRTECLQQLVRHGQATIYLHKDNTAKLNELLEKLEPECALPNFGTEAIKQQILSCLTERHRNV